MSGPGNLHMIYQVSSVHDGYYQMEFLNNHGYWQWGVNRTESELDDFCRLSSFQTICLETLNLDVNDLRRR